MFNRRYAALLCVALAGAPAAFAKHRHHDPGSGNGSFDYYVLALSWAPTYCSEHPSDHSSECRTGGRQGFVLHGLWPQAESGPPPMACAPASPVAEPVVDSMLQYYPSRGLIRHEWEEHGTCSGLSAEDYFHRVEQAFKSVQVPDQLRNVSRELDLTVGDLERIFAESNHAPPQAVRISCHNGELVNLELCLSKDLQAQSCSASVRECPANAVSLLPPE